MFINAEKLLIFNFWSSVFNPWLQKYMFLIQFLFKVKTIEPLWCEQQRSGVGPDTGVLLSSGHQILDSVTTGLEGLKAEGAAFLILMTQSSID